MGWFNTWEKAEPVSAGPTTSPTMTVDDTGAYKLVSDKIIDETLARIRGEGDEYCLFDRPRVKYFVSNLAPEKVDEEGEFSESRPNSLGLRFKPQPTADELQIAISFDLFAPSFPTPEEFRAIETTRGEEGSSFTLGSRFFRRFSVAAEGTIDLSRVSEDVTNIEADVQQAVQTEISCFRDDHLFCRHTRAQEVAPVDELSSAEDVREVRSAIRETSTTPTDWRVNLEVSERESEMTLMLTNASDSDRDDRKDEPFVFNPEIRVTGHFDPYEFNTLPEDYRYDREIWAKGQNCSAALEDPSQDDQENSNKRRTIRTTAVPEHQTYRFKHRSDFDEATDQGRLSDPEEVVSALEEIRDGMESYKYRWDNEIREQKEPELTGEEMKEFDRALEKFEEEIRYFDLGISALEDHEEIRRAFALMNEAFSGEMDWDAWRPFQIVFITSNLGDIAAREFPDVATDKEEDAEVLWFPTGGGKTEAYLGLILFSLFFDRIRGRERGVTAWIRFPLRLLATQQKDRFLKALAWANEVRERKLESPGEPFSLGFFMGSHDTPNSIRDGSSGINQFHRTFQSDQGALEEKCRVLDECPSCGAAVEIRYEPKENSVYHECSSDSCLYDDIPLYVTDHDIYRNVPSVLLGTLDKISIMGYNERFANLLGNFTTRCPVHGYGYAGRCPEDTTVGCDEEVEPVPEDERPDDPVPLLHLIDEVHLLDEELGVFASHYETLYQSLCREIGGNEPKVLTSTATISAYKRQMKNLFMKGANRFPEEGPTLKESFYGREVDEPERRYLGLTPNAKSHIYAVLDLAKNYHQVIRDFRKNPPEDVPLDRETLDDILTEYEISVVYFLRKTKKDRYRRSISNQIRRDMKDEGYDNPILPGELTADTDDPEILTELAEPSKPFEQREDTIAATSFIGHGIDIDRFNTMFYFGFPSESFEYIQSSARVGRKYPGSVIDVFKPYDERDKHRYKYFEKSHEYLRRSVEPVSIDRWAKDSVDKTLPGMIEGLLNQMLRPQIYRDHGLDIGSASDFRDMLTEEDSGPDFPSNQLSNLVQAAYGLDRTSNEYFEERVESMVDRYLEYWSKYLMEKPWVTTPEEPMQNLRDIGESEEIDAQDDERGFYKSLLNGGE